MAEKKTLSAKLRTCDFGSAGSRRLVRSGEIPAVIYGKQEPVHVILNAKEFISKKHTYSESTIITLDVEGTEHPVFVKEVQENLLKGIVNHVDFYEVTYGVAVKTRVRVELTGTPYGCKSGGVLDQVIHELEIECLPKDLPEALTADVTNLQINDSLRVEELAIPEGVKVIGDLEATVCIVKAVKEEVVEPTVATEGTDETAPATDASATK